MALKNLAQYTTLGSMAEAQVRSQTGTLDDDQTRVYDKQITDIVHNAILFVRAIAGKLLTTAYTSTITLTGLDTLTQTEKEQRYQIHDIDCYDWNDVSLWSVSNNMKIPLESGKQWDSIFTHKTDEQLAKMIFGKMVAEVVGSNTQLVIRTYSGDELVAGGNVRLTFPRNPRKVTTNTDLLDIPEIYMPIVKAQAVVDVYAQVIKKPAPLSEKTIVAQFVASQIAQQKMSIGPE